MGLDVKSITIKDGNLKYGVWTQSPAELGLSYPCSSMEIEQRSSKASVVGSNPTGDTG